MRIKLSRLVAAGLVSGFLVLGGVSLASAQETPETTESTTPSTVAPESPAETPSDPAQPTPDASGEDPNCPNMGEGSGTGTARRRAHARGRSGPRCRPMRRSAPTRPESRWCAEPRPGSARRRSRLLAIAVIGTTLACRVLAVELRPLDVAISVAHATCSRPTARC